MVLVRALAYTVMSMMELFVCICIEFTGSFGRNCILALAGGRSLRMNMSSSHFETVAFDPHMQMAFLP